MRTLVSMLVASFVALAGAPLPAGAWGSTGHHVINGVAAGALPASVPAFVRTPEAVAEIMTLGTEADRLKGAGAMWDADYDPGHYLDLGDDGTIAGVVALAQLPPTREAYDTAVRRGQPLDGHAPDQYAVGYLPYSIVDGWEQVVKDFAIWRVDRAGETRGATAADRAYFARDRVLREALTVRDIGYWGHFIGDGSQPLHVSVHYNGWGNYPNPQNFTQSKQIHAKFETAFVDAHVDMAGVASRLKPYVPSTQNFTDRVATYLQTTASFVPAVYTFEAQGAIDSGSPAAVSFMLDRLAAAAQFLRDATADAYAASADGRVGYPGISVRDVESGAVVPTEQAAAGG
jgi:hypothetical protein